MAIKNYPKGAKTKLSDNFTVAEFACHGSGCCSTVKIDEQLVIYLQKIRDHFKKKVTITSGYRCEKRNKAVGGVTGSRHAKGQAADIVVEGIAPKEVAKYAESIGIKGIGLYETAKDGRFTHIDTRTTKSFWYGQAQAKRTTFGGAASTGTTYTLKQFIMDVQKAIGAKTDGIAGKETIDKTPTVSETKNRTHTVVKAVQKRLNALGYNCGTADGDAGAKFTVAVKKFQKANGIKPEDGEITARRKTWQKLLGIK